MNEQIHIIPVLDALRAPGACPFCTMYHKLEADAITFIMGPAYMEEDVRTQTNRSGFCKRHTEQLYGEQNRLGLALMLQTHFAQLSRAVEKLAGAKLTKYLRTVEAACYVCSRIDDTFARYMDTFFYLWKKNKEAAQYIAALDGFCMPHFTSMLETAATALDKQRRAAFLAVVLPIQQAAMNRLAEDLDWFAKKFDYRFADEPWHNAKDALPRAMAMLNGENSTQA